MCFEFLYNVYPKLLSFQEEFREIWSKMYICLYVNCPIFVAQILIKHEFSRKVFEKTLKY